MQRWFPRLGLIATIAALSIALSTATSTATSTAQTAAKQIRLALQAGGTASWEIAAMRALKLDAKYGVTLKVRKVAGSRAGQVALQSGSVDVILSDFIWTSLQRHRGADFTFVPRSLAVGGLMVMPGSKVRSLADLKGAHLAVAGGPVDKSYLILQALYAAKTGRNLARDARITFGAPPLVNEELLSGRADASLNFWHYNARATLSGARYLITVPDMLKRLGIPRTPPLLGWVFSQKFAARHPKTIKAFLDASFATKEALLNSDSLWARIRPVMNAKNDKLFIALRDAYRAGIVTSYTHADIEAARATYALIAGYGGAELTGGHDALARGTFWAGYRKPR